MQVLHIMGCLYPSIEVNGLLNQIYSSGLQENCFGSIESTESFGLEVDTEELKVIVNRLCLSVLSQLQVMGIEESHIADKEMCYMCDTGQQCLSLRLKLAFFREDA